MYNTVKTFKVDNFDVEVAWAYEDMPIRDCFDETEEEFAAMQARCENYTDTHYQLRVLAKYDDVEMGSAYLGSCYAAGMDPAQDIEDGVGGYLQDFVSEAVSEAQDEAVAMLDRLKADFLNQGLTVQHSGAILYIQIRHQRSTQCQHNYATYQIAKRKTN